MTDFAKFRNGSIAALAVFATMGAFSTAAHAAGGGGDASTPTCTNGKVYNQQTKKCETKSSSIDQDSYFETGRALAYAGRYDEAIIMLRSAPDQGDARVLNMLGYSHRKLNRVETAMAYYKHSIATDPQYALVREYYGEALLEKGQLSAARGQLDSIRQICGEDCEPYQQLFAAISAHEAGLPIEERNIQRW